MRGAQQQLLRNPGVPSLNPGENMSTQGTGALRDEHLLEGSFQELAKTQRLDLLLQDRGTARRAILNEHAALDEYQSDDSARALPIRFEHDTATQAVTHQN